MPHSLQRAPGQPPEMTDRKAKDGGGSSGKLRSKPSRISFPCHSGTRHTCNVCSNQLMGCSRPPGLFGKPVYGN